VDLADECSLVAQEGDCFHEDQDIILSVGLDRFLWDKEKGNKTGRNGKGKGTVALRHYVSFCYWTKKIYRCPIKNPSTNKYTLGKWKKNMV
jgi:hypothetical protein